MISYERTTSRTSLVIGGSVVAGLMLAGGLWWSHRAGPDDAPAGPATVASAPAVDAGHQDQLKRAAAALNEAPQILPDGRPADFAEDEWKSLKDAVASSPNKTNELNRVADYLRFQRTFELWQGMQDAGNTPERRKLADKLMAALPTRLSNSEVTMGEALMLCAALINDMESDEGRRNQRAEQCKNRLEQAAPQLSSEAQEREAACLADWERRKAAITGEFYNKPPAQRAADQKQFEAELEKARIEVYGSAQCADIK